MFVELREEPMISIKRSAVYFNIVFLAARSREATAVDGTEHASKIHSH